MTQFVANQVQPNEGDPGRKVRRARPAELERVLAVVARAFDDDPFVNWCVAQDKRRASRVYDMMSMAQRISAAHNEVYTTEDVSGAAYWTPPGKNKVPVLQQFRMLPAMNRAITLRRVPKVVGVFTALEKKHPHEPHWYLGVLGVEPELQGKGIGTALLRPILDVCDRDGVPAYLESSKEKNLPLYERNGFKVTETFDIPDGPRIWLMWREPS